MYSWLQFMKIETPFMCGFPLRYFQQHTERESKFCKIAWLDWMKHRVSNFHKFIKEKCISLCGCSSFHTGPVVNPAYRNCCWVDYGPFTSLESHLYKTTVECEISSDLDLSIKEKTADKCGHNHLWWDRLGYAGISLCLLYFLFWLSSSCCLFIKKSGFHI